MKEPLRILFPPQFEPFQPYLSGPYLRGLLACQGIAASVFDSNVDFYWWLVSRANNLLDRRGDRGRDNTYVRCATNEAMKALRTTSDSLLTYRWAVNVVDQYLLAASPVGVKIGLTYLKVGNPYSSTDLQAYLSRPDNIFHAYFEGASTQILGPREVSDYLLSLVVIDQLPAAIAFAREIKRRRPRARVIIGGPIVSRLQRQLSAVPWIAQTFDAICAGEAYRVLPGVLGLSSAYDGHVTPDFSDLDLDRYWSCRKVLPYLVAHGCKWGRCTFCSHHLTYDGYRGSGIPNVLDDLEDLSARHNAHYISFCDEYLTPDQLDELATGLLDRGVDLRWSTFARPEPHFRNRDFVAKLYAAGCRMLMFGLESGSQRVMQAMKKGTRVGNFRSILETCKWARIAVRLDFMVGFPGETEEDVEKTYLFIRQNRDVIDTPFSSYSVAVFELRSGIPVQQQPGLYSLLPRDPLRGDLDDQYEFESATGLAPRRRAEWRERLIRLSKMEMGIELICPQNKTHQLVLKDLYDQGMFDLPVTSVEAGSLGLLRARLASGVRVGRGEGGLRVMNHANGGELEVSRSLEQVFRAFESGENLEAAFQLQSVWDRGGFSRLVSFLYRNDYITVHPVTPDERRAATFDAAVATAG